MTDDIYSLDVPYNSVNGIMLGYVSRRRIFVLSVMFPSTSNIHNLTGRPQPSTQCIHWIRLKSCAVGLHLPASSSCMDRSSTFNVHVTIILRHQWRFDIQSLRCNKRTVCYYIQWRGCWLANMRLRLPRIVYTRINRFVKNIDIRMIGFLTTLAPSRPNSVCGLKEMSSVHMVCVQIRVNVILVD